MSDKKYCIFQVKGGLGKHIAATAVAKSIKKTYPDYELIVIAAWPAIFTQLGFVSRAYQLGNTQYFYDDYVKGKDNKFFVQEPYFTNNHINKKCHLIETWCRMYNLVYDETITPEVVLNQEQRKAIHSFYQSDRPILLLHTSGGPYEGTSSYSWARDMPQDVAQTVANYFSKDRHVVQLTRKNGYRLSGVAVQSNAINNFELIGLLECSSKRLLIDSCTQHAAAALNLPSTVIWKTTSPQVFGYNVHDNVTPLVTPNKSYAWSLYFDYQFDGNEIEFPYTEEEYKNLYDVDYIISSLEKQT